MNDLTGFFEYTLTPMSFSLVTFILAVGFGAAALLLLVNLYRNGFLRGNILGVAVSVVFLATAITFFSHIFLTQSSGFSYWLYVSVNILLAMAIYGFILLSLKSRFVIGGYHALAAARKALAQHERWMQIMQESMTDGLAVFSTNGNLLYINPAALNLLAVSETTMTRRANMMFGIGYKTDLEIADFKLRVLKKHEVKSQIVMNAGTEHEKVVEVKLSPVISKLRRVIAITATYRDVTELYELERAKQEFIQIASHELRTPLTAVRGYLSLLQMDRYGKLSAKQRELIDKAFFASARLSKLVDNLLVVARIEENRVVFMPELVDLDKIVDTVVQELAGEADRCSINLRRLTNVKKLPEILADKEKLEQIITNLVGNAIKYTPAGGHIFVETRLKNGNIELSVSDTGVGIAKSDLVKLFRKFERIKNQRSVQVGGSGLGLVIVKSFTEMHGGKVTVSSSEGHGSIFTIILPVKTSVRQDQPIHLSDYA